MDAGARDDSFAHGIGVQGTLGNQNGSERKEDLGK